MPTADPLSQTSETTPRLNDPVTDPAPVAVPEVAPIDPPVDPAPSSDDLLLASRRINALEEDIAFLRATYRWPTKDRT